MPLLLSGKHYPLARAQPSLELFKHHLKNHLFMKPTKTQGASDAMQMAHYKLIINIVVVVFLFA